MNRTIKVGACLGLLLLVACSTAYAQATNAPPVLTLPPATAAICPPGEGLVFIHDATMEDDGIPGPARVSWEQLGGPAIATFIDRTRLNAIMCVKRPGEYQFRLLADDGEFLVSSDILVTVLPPPASSQVR